MAKKKSEDQTFVSNTLRATDLGQDRYRRRYWHLAHSGGVFVEGIESAEPWKLATQGLRVGEKPIDEEEEEEEEEDDEEGGDEEECDAEEEAEKSGEEDNLTASSPPPAKKPKLDDTVKSEVDDEEEKENDGGVKMPMFSTPCQDRERTETEEALSKLGSEIMVTPKMEVKQERKFSPKVTPNGDRLNLFNHSAYFNMSLSPVVLNGSVTITPKDGQQPLPQQLQQQQQQQLHQQHHHHHHHHQQQMYPHLAVPGYGSHGANEKPWFSLLAKASNNNHPQTVGQQLDPDQLVKQEPDFHPARKPVVETDPFAPQVAMLEHKLEVVRQMNKETRRRCIPLGG